MEKREKIQTWILKNLIEKRENRFDKSSYTLKHLCEFDLGFYVSNSEFKREMRELGYKFKTKGLNDFYTLKKRLYGRDVFQINQIRFRTQMAKLL